MTTEHMLNPEQAARLSALLDSTIEEMFSNQLIGIKKNIDKEELHGKTAVGVSDMSLSFLLLNGEIAQLKIGTAELGSDGRPKEDTIRTATGPAPFREVYKRVIEMGIPYHPKHVDHSPIIMTEEDIRGMRLVRPVGILSYGGFGPEGDRKLLINVETMIGTCRGVFSLTLDPFHLRYESNVIPEGVSDAYFGYFDTPVRPIPQRLLDELAKTFPSN